MLQISGVSLDKPSKVALSLVGSNKVTLFLKAKKVRTKQVPFSSALHLEKKSRHFLIILSHLVFRCLNLCLGMFSYNP